MVNTESRLSLRCLNRSRLRLASSASRLPQDIAATATVFEPNADEIGKGRYCAFRRGLFVSGCNFSHCIDTLRWSAKMSLACRNRSQMLANRAVKKRNNCAREIADCGNLRVSFRLGRILPEPPHLGLVINGSKGHRVHGTLFFSFTLVSSLTARVGVTSCIYIWNANLVFPPQLLRALLQPPLSHVPSIIISSCGVFFAALFWRHFFLARSLAVFVIALPSSPGRGSLRFAAPRWRDSFGARKR